MHKVAILSRDSERYRALIKKSLLPDLELVLVNNKISESFDYSKVDILFGDPDLTSQIVAQCTELKWLQSTWAGNAPLFAVDKNDYQLCGVKGVFQRAMQEYVFAYLLYFSRNLKGFVEAQKRGTWEPPSYQSLAGKTLGIMGVGDIGKGVANMAKNFSMITRGYTRNSHDCEGIDQYYKVNEEQDFATDLDYLVCLLPQSTKTTGLIDKSFLSYLPPHCVLINAGRGASIVDRALIAALQSKALHAAVLDVFTQEPLPKSHPFWQLDNLYITQHTAAESIPEEIFAIFSNNYVNYIDGHALQYVLDFDKGY
ncbi:D-2-hydroxyacid dehydrogenase [Paraglaciecola arctica]|uniref:D-2-hydroxyacid dehydrogenase n=1 Tax=Paraglaciecola arctica TaxID=1128911 RepID=UPI001C073202|nr:D-2-hydroxyacid dehydrogenase [Paraglaciecola arctica]MBU3003848.1 D-2-hydroxyacid dehydrogenase [Paraglaciecola arctica]